MTGAPLFLLHLCKYIKQNSSLEFYFLLKRDGPLRKEFSEIGKTFLYHNASTSSGLISKLKRMCIDSNLGRKSKVYFLKQKLRKLGLNFIYSNTATNGELLQELAELNVKVVTHIHELEWAINSFGTKNLYLTKQLTSHYISSSPSVTALIKKYFYPDNNVCELKCFPIHSVPNDFDSTLIKVSLGIPSDGFIVGAAGTVEWRKGWDLFVRLAWELKRLDQDAKVFFVWVGKVDEKYTQEVKYEVELAGLEHTVFFVGQKQNPMQYYALFDVFCLMSREEAFGIVALENAQFKTPTVCFDKAEGIASFIQSDAGIILPFLDTHKMAEAILMLKDNPDETKKMGETAFKRVNNSYKIEEQGQKLVSFLTSIKNA